MPLRLQTEARRAFWTGKRLNGSVCGPVWMGKPLNGSVCSLAWTGKPLNGSVCGPVPPIRGWVLEVQGRGSEGLSGHLTAGVVSNVSKGRVGGSGSMWSCNVGRKGTSMFFIKFGPYL